ncbi:MAG: OsmC family protein [Candidatus Rokubacteria bacterium]|nr:OsmC family protein [Candidatus Rokubacteria bacterium]
MAESDFRQRQNAIKDDLRRDPAKAVVTDLTTSLPSDPRDPMRVRVGRAGAFEISIGAHRGVGGDGALPCPGDVLAAALAGCQELTVRMVAASTGIELADVRVEVEGTADLRGALGLDRTVKVGVQKLALRTHVTLRDGDPERARRLLQAAERYCSILDTLRNPPEITTTFTASEADR